MEERTRQRLEFSCQVTVDGRRVYKIGGQNLSLQIIPFQLEQVCCICLLVMALPNEEGNVIDDNHLQQTNCNHFICRDCFWKFLQAWDQQSMLNCPYCRRILLRPIMY